MNFRFYIDPETGDPHILRHRVSEEEVKEIFLSPTEDRPGRDGARLLVGRTEEGRFIRIIYVRDPEPGSVFVVTAYELTERPLRALMRRWMRRN